MGLVEVVALGVLDTDEFEANRCLNTVVFLIIGMNQM